MHQIKELRVHLLERLTSVRRMVTWPRTSLRLKLISILIGIVFLGTAFSSVLVASMQRQQLIDQAQSDAMHIGAVIEASLFHSMSDSNSDMIKNMVTAEASGANLEYIRILDQSGMVWLSSNSSETGHRFEQTDSPCSGCHQTRSPVDKNVGTSSSQIIGDSLVTINLLVNQPACYACHGTTPGHLGFVLIAAPLAALRTQLTLSLGWLVFAGLLTFALLVGLLTPALEKFVTRPVEHLVKGAAAIGSGNLDYTCNLKTNDELGELALTFDTMRQRLKETLAESEKQNRELRMLNEIARVTNQLLEPQQILDLTIKVVVSSLGVQAGAIRVIDRENRQFTLHACCGIAECRPEMCDLRAINIALATLAHENNQRNPASLSTSAPSFQIRVDAQGCAYVGIPLEAEGALMGGLTLITHPQQSVTEEGARVLKAMGQQIGMAVLNAFRFQHARYEATLEERERLAREMHDSLAQSLGYLKMKTAMTDALLSGGQIDQAQVSLLEVKEIAGETYLDVREVIFGLRNPPSKSLRFLPDLTEYLSKYQLHYGLNVQLKAKDDCSPSFSPEVTLQLTRIIQEALSNVRKHTQLNQATICLERDDHHWCITIEDEGNGFDPREINSDGWQFLGSHIMRERAESIGAEFQIDTQPGWGTRVIVRLPFESEV